MEFTVGVERRIFEEDVPEEFLVATIDCLLDSYVEAHTHCKMRYGKSEFRYVMPHLQRANFEGDWRKLARSFKGSKARVVKNARGDGHTRYVFGRVVMTASAVQEPEQIPRDAQFRKTNAGEQQLDLLSPNADLPAKDAALYAMLTHGPRLPGHPLPSFIRIGFPSKDCSEFVDYFDLTPLLYERMAPQNEEEAAPEPPSEKVPDLVLRLRDKIKKRKA